MKKQALSLRLSWRITLAILVLAGMGAVLWSWGVYAAEPIGAPVERSCSLEIARPPILGADGSICSAYGGVFLSKIVPCITISVLSAVAAVLEPISIFMKPAVMAFGALAVTVFGLKILMGREKPLLKSTVIFGVKIALGVAFSYNFACMYWPAIYAVDDLLGIVVRYTTAGTALGCPFVVDPQRGGSIWFQLDCVLGKLIGGMMIWSLASGFIGFLVAALASGPVGFFIFILGVAIILCLVLAIIKSAYIFIMSYIGLAFMLAISPLFVPLVFFKITKAYFDKWLKLAMGFMLQPIFLFAFTAMLLVVFDVTLFMGPKSVFRQIGAWWIDVDKDCGAGDLLCTRVDNVNGQCILNSANCGTGTLANRDIFRWAYNFDPSKTDQMPGQAQTGAYGGTDRGPQQGATLGQYRVNDPDAWKDIMKHMEQGSGGHPMVTRMPALNFCALASNICSMTTRPPVCDRVSPPPPAWCARVTPPIYCARDPDCMPDYPRADAKTMLTNLVLSMLIAAITAYIMFSLLNYVPFLGASLAGELYSMPNLAQLGKGGMPGMKNLSGAISKATRHQ